MQSSNDSGLRICEFHLFFFTLNKFFYLNHHFITMLPIHYNKAHDNYVRTFLSIIAFVCMYYTCAEFFNCCTIAKAVSSSG